MGVNNPVEQYKVRMLLFFGVVLFVAGVYAVTNTLFFSKQSSVTEEEPAFSTPEPEWNTAKKYGAEGEWNGWYDKSATIFFEAPYHWEIQSGGVSGLETVVLFDPWTDSEYIAVEFWDPNGSGLQGQDFETWKSSQISGLTNEYTQCDNITAGAVLLECFLFEEEYDHYHYFSSIDQRYLHMFVRTKAEVGRETKNILGSIQFHQGSDSVNNFVVIP